jgi:hypothetical protein
MTTSPELKLEWLSPDNAYLKEFTVKPYAARLNMLELFRQQFNYTHDEAVNNLAVACQCNVQMAYRAMKHYNALYINQHGVFAFKPVGKPTALPTLHQIQQATSQLNELRKQMELKLGIIQNKML